MNKFILRSHFSLRELISITVAFSAIVMLFFAWSCSDGKLEVAEETLKRDAIPVLKGHDVTTIISDSGVARYRITTQEWLVFDKVKDPYWLFPKGIHFERFTPDYKIDAHMTSKQAKYHETIALWEFNGDVEAKNLQGELFQTQQLFWDENRKRIYSDKEIVITQHFKVIKGVGFESNSSLTRYIIRRPTGIIPINN